MDNITALLHGLRVAATPINLLMALAGAFVGTIVGLLPGIGPINGVAILLPIAFAMKVPADLGADPAGAPSTWAASTAAGSRRSWSTSRATRAR